MAEKPRIILPLEVMQEVADSAANMIAIPSGPKGLKVHLDEDGRRLTTPWQVCLIRARLLQEGLLPEGAVLDPACGAGLQLAALSHILGRKAIGVELDSSRAMMAACNLQRISEFHDCSNDGVIITGDGTDSTTILDLVTLQEGIALLYLDPARPSGSTEHVLTEMQPRLDEVFDAWKPHLNQTAAGPAIVLDLSPRLSVERRAEVEALVLDRWSSILMTWQWASRGSGRIDRLSLWIGAAAEPDKRRRFVRIPPEIHAEPLFLSSGDETAEELQVERTFPRRGEWLTMIDAALVSSGMASSWLERVLAVGDSARWQVVKGRRPMLSHTMPLRYEHPLDHLLIQCTGKIVSLVRTDIDMEHIDIIVEKAKEAGFTKLTLRLALAPDLQPVMQRELDRCLSREGGEKAGFIVRTGAQDHLLLCHQE